MNIDQPTRPKTRRRRPTKVATGSNNAARPSSTKLPLPVEAPAPERGAGGADPVGFLGPVGAWVVSRRTGVGQRTPSLAALGVLLTAGAFAITAP